MKAYLNFLGRSFLYAGLFGIIYNTIIYVIWSQTFIGATHDFRMFIPALLYFYANEESSQTAIDILDHDLIIIFLHGFLSHVEIIFLFSLLVFWMNKKQPDSESRKTASLKIMKFALACTLLISILALIGMYLYAVNNKEKSWFPSDVVFERKLPASVMFRKKYLYMCCGMAISLLFSSKITRLPRSAA